MVLADLNIDLKYFIHVWKLLPLRVDLKEMEIFMKLSQNESFTSGDGINIRAF